MQSIIKNRTSSTSFGDLSKYNFHPVLQRIYETRGIQSYSELNHELNNILPFKELLGINTAADLLYQALRHKQHIMIIGDFDADGATSTALGVKVLNTFGATKVSYLVPNRFEYGYGLSPEIVTVAAKQKPDLIMTVDNGISSIEGVKLAKEMGMTVVVTDHHLQGDQLPEADAIVNPNQKGDPFPSKSLAGVGVCFYVLLALRTLLIEKSWFDEHAIPKPNMANFLDIVALGTVADVVPLDQNNRILVHQGIRRIRAKRCTPGIQALLEIAKRSIHSMGASDLGFAIGPRLNAAGRLDDMSIGIKCLLAETIEEARHYASQLDGLNRERREIEQGMKQEAFRSLKQIDLDSNDLPHGLCIYKENWHQGVIGILASRIKDQYHRPVIVFAEADDINIKGSARSVKGVHIRDVLDSIAKQRPEMIDKFGGHAMAAGLTISKKHFSDFEKAFNKEVKKHLPDDQLRGEILTDGGLSNDDFNLGMAELLEEAGPWGQEFPAPLFNGRFTIVEQRIVGTNHLKLSLQHEGGEKVISAIKFNIDENEWPNHRCEKVRCAYRLDINEFNDTRRLQLMIEHIEPIL